MILKNNKSEIALSLIFPLYGIISYLKETRRDYFSYPLLIFFVFFGLLFVVPNQGDAARHVESLQSYTSMTWSQFTQEVVNIVSLNSASHSDVYIVFSNFLVSRFSTSSSVYFGFHAVIYGVLFLLFFKLLSKELSFKLGFIHQVIFLTLFLVFSIAKIQYVRFFLAALFFLYACYSHILKGDRKFWIYFVLATLVHVSLVIPSTLFLVFIFFQRRLTLWFIIAVIAFSSSGFLSQYTGNILVLSSEYAADSRIDSMTEGYLGNEDYIAERATRFDERTWFTSYNIYMSNALAIISVVFFFLLKFKKIHVPKMLTPLFTFSLFLFSLSQFGNAFASVGERFSTLFIFSSLYICFVIYSYLSANQRKVVFVPMLPVFFLYIVMSLREIIVVASVFNVIGSPFLIPFIINDPISIYDFIHN